MKRAKRKAAIEGRDPQPGGNEYVTGDKASFSRPLNLGIVRFAIQQGISDPANEQIGGQKQGNQGRSVHAEYQSDRNGDRTDDQSLKHAVGDIFPLALIPVDER